MSNASSTIAYRRVGNPILPCIVWLHGFLGFGQEFRPFADRFRDSFQSILVDLPGHGQSVLDPADERNLSLDRIASDLSAILDEEGIDAATIIGYSMGGRCALRFAINYPNKTRSLVLESVSPGIPDAVARAARAELDTERGRQIRDAGLAEFVTRWYEAELFRSLRRDRQQLEKLVNLRTQNEPRAMSQVVEQLSPGRQPSSWRSLPGLEAPTLYLSGSRDGKYHALGKRIARISPRVRFESVAGAGHNIHFEAPEAYLAAVTSFVNDHLSTS